VRDGGGGMTTTGADCWGLKNGRQNKYLKKMALHSKKIKLLGHVKGNSVRTFVL
jgi:hypothetical protein